MIDIKGNISLAPYTMYKIGGPARYFTQVPNAEELGEALAFARNHNAPFFILGAGSNILISDRGFNGLAIKLVRGAVMTDGNNLIMTADVMMAQAVAKAAEAGLSGIEWGIGIPGTVGGAVRGNAGCFGGEMKDVVHTVRYIDAADGDFRELDNKGCVFGYRDSLFKKHSEWVVVSVTLALHPGDKKEIQNEVSRITKERAFHQDIGTKSCGCIFKNIFWERGEDVKERLLAKFPALAEFRDRPAIPASFLIDAAGLKGRRVGPIVVSEKHANYFVNEGGGRAEDVVMLISIVKDAVVKKFGILLEEEIQYIGF